MHMRRIKKTIRLTAYQQKLLRELAEMVNEAFENGHPGAIMGELTDDLTWATFTFLPHDEAITIMQAYREKPKEKEEE